MLTNLRRSIGLMVLLTLLSSLAGCDKMTTLIGNLKKSEEAKQEKPAAHGSYRREQISNITSADFAGFTSRKTAQGSALHGLQWAIGFSMPSGH